jgi:uncharacterized membrane protein
MKQIYSFFRPNILTGILVTVPFVLTLFILYIIGKWIIEFVNSKAQIFTGGLLDQLHPAFAQTITFLIGVLVTLLIVLIVGAVARNFLGRKLVGFGEYLIIKIPLARTIYIAIKQITETLFMGTGLKNLKRVALFEYPRKGIYSIGFITGTLEPGQHHNQTEKTLVSIFVPTTPNPTSGYYIMLPKEDVRELPISVEDAFRIIMSAGLATNKIDNAGTGNKNS